MRAYKVIGFVLAIGLSGCGGGGGSSTGTTTTTATVHVTGKVTYTTYDIDAVNGINYALPIEKPIRGAVIELWDSSNNVIASEVTSPLGGYLLTGPENSSLRVVVKAALGDPASPNTKVVDNTNIAALYTIVQDVTTGSADLLQDFNAGSGWDSGTQSYTSTRAAAPFAILDAIYQAQQKVLAADNTVVFPYLAVNWSPNNLPVNGSPSLGEIGISHYDPGTKQLYILGAEGNDTDEYDSHVVVHEWGHYFEDNFSRSDNPGGSHGIGDFLHLSIAFGEGYGNALSGMILDSPFYRDTSGPQQASIGVDMDLDADSISDASAEITTGKLYDGPYSEVSVQEILYDLYDSGSGDDDGVALGFAPIYRVLIGGQKDTPAFTSIFSFLNYLKQAEPSSAVAITDVASAENVDAGDEYEGASDRYYTDVPADGSLVTTDFLGSPLQTSDVFGPIAADDPGNKLYNRVFFKATVVNAGCYTLTVSPNTAADDLVIIAPGGGVDDAGPGVAETLPGTFAQNEVTVFSVGSFGAPAGFSVQMALTPAVCP